jgi:signal transduction histidine kinase
MLDGWRAVASRLDGRPQRRDLVDALLAACMGAVVTATTLSGNYETSGLAGSLVWGWLFVLPLAARRRFPVTVWLVVLALMVAQAASTGSVDTVGVFFGLLVGCYTMAAHTPARTAVVCLLVLVPVAAYSNWRTTGDPFDDLAFLLVLVGGFWVAGRVVFSREQLVARLAEQADELRRSREAEARARVAEQRARIARDVHDVVAHSVSLMVVQAEAGEAQLDPREPSAECLRAIQRVGRATLGELRGVLGALGDDTGDWPSPERPDPVLAPTPRLREATRLVSELEKAGLDIDFTLDGDPGSLPVGVDLAGYRILQEALTNALRHAAGAHVTARVVVTGDEVVVEVRNTAAGHAGAGNSGAGVSRAGNGTGRGLLGMAERVRLYGGQVDAGPDGPDGPDGTGFRVHARIPATAGAAAPR